MSPLLAVQDLEVKYRTRKSILTAVRQIAFEVERGEIVGIVGESGCGKSTVASAVLGLLPSNGDISQGQIWFGGRDLRTQSRETLRQLRGSEMSMIFQDPMTSLNPVFSIESQMLDILRTHNERQRESQLREQAIDMLDRVGIPDAAERIENYPHQFSGGMRQRIMIAMALMSNPALLIADEPTSALDVTLEAQILELIQGLRHELGTAILYISHDLGVIAQLCDRVIVMYAGRIVEQGQCLALFEQARHPYTQALLATYPSHRQRVDRLASIGGLVPSLRALPRGCKFADRCAYVQPICRDEEPELVTYQDGRQVLCHFHSLERMEGRKITTTAVRSRPATESRSNAAPRSLVAIKDLRTHFADRVALVNQLLGQRPGHVRAVDGIEINIRPGETIGLVGESGSGKTTLGKTILRLVDATGGRILFDGQDITAISQQKVRPLRRRMQMIFQDPCSSLSPRLKVSTIIIEPFRIQGIPVDAEKKVTELLRMVGLSEEQADKYPHELSGGQARRVGIARALALSPEFLVADEPTAGLDVSVAAGVLNLLKDLREQLGLTYLIITHNLNVIGFISDRVGVMYLGKLMEIGTTEDIFSRPRHPYTEALISAISEPDPRLREVRGRRILLKGEIPSPKNPPPGCPFHPRCRYAEKRCQTEVPMLGAIQGEHLVACHFPDRVTFGSSLRPPEGI